MAHDSSVEEKKYKHTLNLPQTDFPIRAQSAIDDPALIERWKKEDIYAKSCENSNKKTPFIFHDGPPYANGHIHLGSAYNKILKDIICKSKRMSGFFVPVIPGWDCHGLPIEFNVNKEQPNLDPVALKKACRAYATQWMQIQRQEFCNLGVLMNWDHPYLTMDFGYEAQTLQAFGMLLEKGYIEKKYKTVPWCYSCQTVLATAEIEYKERKDPSLYVLFPLSLNPHTRTDVRDLGDPRIRQEENHSSKVFWGLNKPINLVIWTTTPWTLPLNRAVLIKPHSAYEVLSHNDQLLIVGQELSEKVCQLLGIEKKVVATIPSSQLAHYTAQHPFVDRYVPIIESQNVSLEDGTALVHCAPGCGPEDYEVGLKHNLEIYSPVQANGTYSAAIVPAELAGKPVAEAHGWVIGKLEENKNLLHKNSIKHSYPHCWRCRNGLIFRATKQWFLNLEHNELREKAVQKIENTIQFFPAPSVGFLKATIQGRLEWCLSRQRHWGVPIPAIICSACDHTFISPELINFVAKKVEQEGIEYWDRVSIKELPISQTCTHCKSTDLKKEKDILDVWFESGISHYAVLYKKLGFPADMYAEGVDQHRGWFQSSLLTSLAIEQEPCTKAIVSHGYVVDERGHKMSKSLGNVVTPQEIIKKIGTDGLRLWVSSITPGNDPVVSENLMTNIAEVFRKIRNTARFLLSNIYDFDIKKDAIILTELSAIDQYALERLCELNKNIQHAYATVDTTAVFHHLADYCTTELSSLYLDVIKDRLYVEKSDSKKRRAAQTVCWHILDTLTKLMAPIMSFTAEQLSDHYQKNKAQSIHLQEFNDLKNVGQGFTTQAPIDAADWYPYKAPITQNMENMQKNAVHNQLTQAWELVFEIRKALLKAIEQEREKGIIKHSLEAAITVYFELSKEQAHLFKLLKHMIENSKQTIEQFWKELLIVSEFSIHNNSNNLQESSEFSGLWIKVEHARGNKCPRCWHWDTTNHPDHLCKRCFEIVK